MCSCIYSVGKRHTHNVQCCLDKTMVNDKSINQFPASHSEFLELIESDYSPVITTISCEFEQRQGQFRFDGQLLENDGFRDVVINGWRNHRQQNLGTIQQRLIQCHGVISRWKRLNKPNAQVDIARLKQSLDVAVSSGAPPSEIHNL